MRIGIFGGTFNPFHIGHYEMLKALENNENIDEIIIEIAGYLSKNIRDLMPEKLDWIYHSMACRAAVKAGNFTSDYEAEKFVGVILSNDDIRYCPHGRPVLVEMTKRAAVHADALLFFCCFLDS